MTNYDVPEVEVQSRQFGTLYDEVMNNLLDAENIHELIMPQVSGPRWNPKLKWPSTSLVALALSRSSRFIRVSKKGERIDVSPPTAVVRAIREEWLRYCEAEAARRIGAYSAQADTPGIA